MGFSTGFSSTNLASDCGGETVLWVTSTVLDAAGDVGGGGGVTGKEAGGIPANGFTPCPPNGLLP